MNFLQITLLSSFAGFSIFAQPKDIFQPEPPKKPNITEIAPGVFKVGTVKLEKEKKEGLIMSYVAL